MLGIRRWRRKRAGDAFINGTHEIENCVNTDRHERKYADSQHSPCASTTPDAQTVQKHSRQMDDAHGMQHDIGGV